MIHVKNYKHVILNTCLSTIIAMLYSYIFVFIFMKLNILMYDSKVLFVAVLIPATVAPFMSYIAFKQALYLEQSKQEILRLSRIDDLTGLFNKAYFYEIAEREITLSERYKYSVAIVVMDLDFFKRINDTYGHLAGDKVIKHSAELIKQNIREIDLVCRFGGEEMIILFPQANLKETIQIIERIRTNIKNAITIFDQNQIKVTASFGVSIYNSTKGKEHLNTLIHYADKALYKAKENGRNRYEICEKC